MRRGTAAVAAKLIVPEDESSEGMQATDSLLRAVSIVALADVVMSLDNVIAIAAVAHGNWYSWSSGSPSRSRSSGGLLGWIAPSQAS